MVGKILSECISETVRYRIFLHHGHIWWGYRYTMSLSDFALTCHLTVMSLAFKFMSRLYLNCKVWSVNYL